MHVFVILQFYTILCILICCEAPRTILDLALYQIKYIIIDDAGKNWCDDFNRMGHINDTAAQDSLSVTLCPSKSVLSHPGDKGSQIPTAVNKTRPVQVDST